MPEPNASTALAVQDASRFPALTSPDARVAVRRAFTELGLTKFQLQRIKVPAGGGIAFTVPGLDGPTVAQTLDAVVVGMKGNERAWYRASFDESGGGTPPDCASHDGIHAQGVNSLGDGAEPGPHDCPTCPWSQFGSDRRGGPGQDCAESIHLFLMLPGSRIPYLLVAPPTSLKTVREYALRLLDRDLDAQSVVTRLGLEQDSSASGISYSKLKLSSAGPLPPEAAAAARSFAEEFMPRVLGNPTAAAVS